MSQDWINYVEGALAETRDRDNAILGGVRPEAVIHNRQPGAGLAAVGLSGLSGLGSTLGIGSQGASSVLAEAGLNGNLEMQGNGDGAAGPFSISAGISSGFHSSSDEDDDDVEENDEDVNNEVSIPFSLFRRLPEIAEELSDGDGEDDEDDEYDEDDEDGEYDEDDEDDEGDWIEDEWSNPACEEEETRQRARSNGGAY